MIKAINQVNGDSVVITGKQTPSEMTYVLPRFDQIVDQIAEVSTCDLFGN